MPFSWPTFLEQHRIEYREESARELLIACPFCGTDDPSKHLSINLQGRGFRCFRHEDHKGKNPSRLVQALLNCSIEHARNICGQNSIQLGGGFAAQLAQILQANDNHTRMTNKPPAMPDCFHPLQDKPSAWPFLSHMKKRGYSLKSTLKLARKYDLRYCKNGVYQGRIIFPIKRNVELLNWTGRTIINDPTRYRSHTTDPLLAERLGMEPAAESISNLLLWHDQVEDSAAETLVIVEGPFDALRANHLGNKDGIIATCLFTMRASARQLDSLEELLPKFQRIVLMLDQKTLDKAVSISMQLPSIEIISLPKELSDPGEIPDTETLIHLLG